MSPPTITLAPTLVARLFRDAGAERWSITLEEFGERLMECAHHAFPNGAGDREANRYLEGLHLADLNGCPQDIEWAYDATGLYMLQSRPVTTT